VSGWVKAPAEISRRTALKIENCKMKISNSRRAIGTRCGSGSFNLQFAFFNFQFSISVYA